MPKDKSRNNRAQALKKAGVSSVNKDPGGAPNGWVHCVEMGEPIEDTNIIPIKVIPSPSLTIRHFSNQHGHLHNL
jgi:hypothetical protein